MLFLISNTPQFSVRNMLYQTARQLLLTQAKPTTTICKVLSHLLEASRGITLGSLSRVDQNIVRVGCRTPTCALLRIREVITMATLPSGLPTRLVCSSPPRATLSVHRVYIEITEFCSFPYLLLTSHPPLFYMASTAHNPTAENCLASRNHRSAFQRPIHRRKPTLT